MALQSRTFRGHLAVNLNCNKLFNFVNPPRVKGTVSSIEFNTKRLETTHLPVCSAHRRETGGHPPEPKTSETSVTEDPKSSISNGFPSVQRKRKPMSEETKKKIAAAKRGKKQSDETKTKISQTMSSRTLSMGHRFQISKSRKGKYHSAETREKISEAVRVTKAALKRNRLAERAAAAAVAATADIRDSYYKDSDEDSSSDDMDAGLISNMIDLEKAVIEVIKLRDQLTSWMDAYEAKYGKKPDLTEASESHPRVYGKFVRYVALRELVRQSSVKMGSSPVIWG